MRKLHCTPSSLRRLGALVLTLTTLAAAVHADTPVDRAAETRAAMAAADWNKAYLAARDWLHEERNDPEALAAMASIYLQLNAPAASIEFARKGLAAGADQEQRAQLLVVQALAHAQVGEYAASWNVHNRVLAELPAGSPAREFSKHARWDAFANAMEREARGLMLSRISTSDQDAGAEPRATKTLFALSDQLGVDQLRTAVANKTADAGSLELGVVALTRLVQTIDRNDRAARNELLGEAEAWITLMEAAGFDAFRCRELREQLEWYRPSEPASEQPEESADSADEIPDFPAEDEDDFIDEDGGFVPERMAARVAAAREPLDRAAALQRETAAWFAELDAWTAAGQLPADVDFAAHEARAVALPARHGDEVELVIVLVRELEALQVELRYQLPTDMGGELSELNGSLTAAENRAYDLYSELESQRSEFGERWNGLRTALERGRRREMLRSATSPQQILTASDELWLAGEDSLELWSMRGDALRDLGHEEEACYAYVRSRVEALYAGAELAADAMAESDAWLETRLAAATTLAREAATQLDREDLDAAREKLDVALAHDPLNAEVLLMRWKLARATEHPATAARALRGWWMAGGNAGDDLLELLGGASEGGDWELLDSIARDGVELFADSDDAWYYAMLAAVGLDREREFEDSARVVETSRHHAHVAVARSAMAIQLGSADDSARQLVEAIESVAGSELDAEPWNAWKRAFAAVTTPTSDEALAELRVASLDPRVPALARAVAARLSRQRLQKLQPAHATLPLRAQDPCHVAGISAWSRQLLQSLAPGQLIVIDSSVDFTYAALGRPLRVRGASAEAKLHFAARGPQKELGLGARLVELERVALDLGGAKLRVDGGSVVALEQVDVGAGEMDLRGALYCSGGRLDRSAWVMASGELRVRGTTLTGSKWSLNALMDLADSYFAADEPALVVHTGGFLVLDDVAFTSRRREGASGVALKLTGSGRCVLRDSRLVGLRAGDLVIEGDQARLETQRSRAFGSLELVAPYAPATWNGTGLELRPAPLPGTRSEVDATEEAQLRELLAAAQPGQVVGLYSRDLILTQGPLIVPEGVGIEGKLVKGEDGIHYVSRVRFGGSIAQAIVAEHDGAIWLSGLSFGIRNTNTVQLGSATFHVADETARYQVTSRGGCVLLENCFLGGGEIFGDYTGIDLRDGAFAVANDLRASNGLANSMRLGAGTRAYLNRAQGMPFKTWGPGRLFVPELRDESTLVVSGEGARCNAAPGRVQFQRGAGDPDDVEVRRMAVARRFRDKTWVELRDSWLARLPNLTPLQCAEISRTLSEEFVASGERAGTPPKETVAYVSDFLYPYLDAHPDQAGPIMIKIDTGAFDLALAKERLSPATRQQVRDFAKTGLQLGTGHSLGHWIESYEFLRQYPPGSRAYNEAQWALRSGTSVAAFRAQQEAKRQADSAALARHREQAEAAARMQEYWARQAEENSFRGNSYDSYDSAGSAWSSWSAGLGKRDPFKITVPQWTQSEDARADQYRRDLDTRLRRSMGGY